MLTKTKLPWRSSYAHHNYGQVLVILAIVGLCGMLGLHYLTPGSALANEPARPADEFVNSIGINVHMHYSPGPYTNLAKVQSTLTEAGIRNVRDYPVNTDALIQLGQSGIKISAIIANPAQGSWALSFNQYWANVKKIAPYLGDIENLNEPDNNVGGDWQTITRNQQKQIWDAAKADPALRDIPIAGPSLTFPAKVAASLGDISANADWGNAHPYPGGNIPSTRISGDMAATKQYNVANKPVIMTETGYHNAINSTSTHLPASEAAAGIYLPRLFLNYFNLGVPRTFSYELVDQGTGDTNAESRFGIMHNDFSPKPAFTAIKNLTTLLKDPGDSFTPSSLSYSLSGANSQTNTTLLQKRDGTHWLAVWQDTSVWDTQTRKAVTPASVPISLQLGSSAAAIHIYAPNVSTAIAASGTGTTMPFIASAAVTLIEIQTGTIPSPPPPTSNADLNGDGKVNITDLSILLSNFNTAQTSTAKGDLNNDGKVGLTDLSILLSAWKP